jgi:hypothetical protein
MRVNVKPDNVELLDIEISAESYKQLLSLISTDEVNQFFENCIHEKYVQVDNVKQLFTMMMQSLVIEGLKKDLDSGFISEMCDYIKKLEKMSVEEIEQNQSAICEQFAEYQGYINSR